MTVRVAAAFAATVFWAGLAAPALGGGTVDPDTYDLMGHRQCFKVKDSGKVKGLVDVFTVRYGTQSGCKLKKADHVCLASRKGLVSATFDKAPVGPFALNDRGDADAAYPAAQICYKAKCPKAELGEVELQDQFGQRPLALKKTAYICAPAVRPCGDPTRTTLVVGRGSDGRSCRQFDGNQSACETAWRVGRGPDVPTSCFYTAAGECHGCSTGPTATSEGCTNTCAVAVCASPALTAALGRCSDIGDQPTCDASFGPGWFGYHSCFWDAVDMRCSGCGPANELAGNCTNICRAAGGGG